MKTIKLLLFLILCSSLQFCIPKREKNQNSREFKVGLWIGAKKDSSNAYHNRIFSKLSNAGINEILINTGESVEYLNRIIPIANKNKLEVNAWMFTMNRPGDLIALNNPDWYAVNRLNESCFDVRPYVDYYQWLCPNNDESINHVLSLVDKLANVAKLKSVHLDYIRFSDIFLPKGLLPKYDLVQNKELPRYDYCYCSLCREKFKYEHGRDPILIENPELDIEWRQFRLNSIKKVVDKAYEIVKGKNINLSAAVFPYPTMAAQMVRQRWDKWNVDHVYPMLYNNFYEEPIDWIGYATKQNIEDNIKNEMKISSGIYLPSINTEEIGKIVKMVYDNGADGISFFDYNSLTEEKLVAIEKALLNLKTNE